MTFQKVYLKNFSKYNQSKYQNDLIYFTNIKKINRRSINIQFYHNLDVLIKNNNIIELKQLFGNKIIDYVYDKLFCEIYLSYPYENHDYKNININDLLCEKLLYMIDFDY